MSLDKTTVRKVTDGTETFWVVGHQGTYYPFSYWEHAAWVAQHDWSNLKVYGPAYGKLTRVTTGEELQ